MNFHIFTMGFVKSTLVRRFNMNSFVYLFLVVLLVGYGGSEVSGVENTTRIQDIVSDKWEKLESQKIYFGHQSVGINIMDGINDILSENPSIKINILESNQETDFIIPAFYHSKIGENTKPETKLFEFKKLFDGRLGQHIDIAFLKFCWIDITSETDIEKLFTNYKRTFDILKKENPTVKFVHFTTPLTTIPKGPKAWLKKKLGKPITGYTDNIKRNKYNQNIIDTYKGKEPIFDLAQVESTLQNGARASFLEKNVEYYYLNESFTDDGGHLNGNGKRVVAENLLLFLVTLND